MESRPAIKSALSIWLSPNGAQVFLGSPYKSICLPSLWFGISTRLLLESFNGQLSLEQISKQCALTISQLQALVDELQAHDLIDLERTAISYLKRYDPRVKAITPVWRLNLRRHLLKEEISMEEEARLLGVVISQS